MATHRISVNVGTDSIRVDPDSLIMTTADEVEWAASGSRRFTISFEGKGPFARPNLSHDEASARQKPRLTGRFKYSVASAENPGLVLDPEIVVGDPPTGHTP